jgi:hypothetical protein
MRRCFVVLAAWLVASCAWHRSPPKLYSWDEKSATFRWQQGEVRLPPGYQYKVGSGIDSFAGSFTSPGGSLIVRHDIGSMAGAYAARDGALFFEERTVAGARVWIGRKDETAPNGHTTLMAVTFPDSGCANFFLWPARAEDAAVIDSIARSFRPIGSVRSEPTCNR